MGEEQDQSQLLTKKVLLALDDFGKGGMEAEVESAGMAVRPGADNYSKVKYAAGASEVQEHSAHGVADTKDEYVAMGLEEQGKAQLVTNRDLSARDNFSKGGMGLEIG